MNSVPEPSPRNDLAGNRLARSLLVAAGIACVVLAVAGVFLPLLPTTPFLLMAAVCFARSSPRLLHWLNHNRWFGEYLRNYREGRGIPLREKLITIALLWLTIGATVIFLIQAVWAKILLIVIATAVTTYLLSVTTLKPGAPEALPD